MTALRAASPSCGEPSGHPFSGRGTPPGFCRTLWRQDCRRVKAPGRAVVSGSDQTNAARETLVICCDPARRPRLVADVSKRGIFTPQRPTKPRRRLETRERGASKGLVAVGCCTRPIRKSATEKVGGSEIAECVVKKPTALLLALLPTPLAPALEPLDPTLQGSRSSCAAASHARGSPPVHPRRSATSAATLSGVTPDPSTYDAPRL